MTSMIPGDISNCWEFYDPGTKRGVKACTPGSPGGRVVRFPVASRTDIPASLKNAHVKKCDPKKEKACDVSIGDQFFNFCDPKKDKKCKINFGDLVLDNLFP